MVFIERQEILKDMMLFTSRPKAKFYDVLFQNLDTSAIAPAKTGRSSPKQAYFCAFAVMKREGFSQITDLRDYLSNNLLIAYYCGFDITKPLPLYWSFELFLHKIDNGVLKNVMQCAFVADIGYNGVAANYTLFAFGLKSA
jgi:hypothetical protein